MNQGMQEKASSRSRKRQGNGFSLRAQKEPARSSLLGPAVKTLRFQRRGEGSRPGRNRSDMPAWAAAKSKKKKKSLMQKEPGLPTP